MISPETILSFFAIIALSSVSIFVAKRFGLPHTVFLVVLGAILGFLSFTGPFEFIRHFELTPELLFYLLLPTLIFESAYAMSSRKMAESSIIILLLAIVSILISAFAIAFVLQFLLQLVGFTIPFLLLLLFGTLISATDPVAVLALFKEYGAPERLSMIFEGESLFNDATAVALFFIILGIITEGFHGTTTLLLGFAQFGFMMIGGIIFGVCMGLLFAYFVGMTRESEVASITLTIALAHLTFILAEIISTHLIFDGVEFHLSSIIATTVASLIMGNYGYAKLHPAAEPFIHSLWSQLAFLSNSAIFVLIGLLFVRTQVFTFELLIPIVLSVIVVAAARAFSIYPVTFLYNTFAPPAKHIPLAWSHLLSWGSLRGALAITMVLLIPEELTLAGWTLEMSPRDFLLALTSGCIAATLFIKATSMQRIMKLLGLDTRTRLEEFEYQEAHALIHKEVSDKIVQYCERGYVLETDMHLIQKVHTEAAKKAHAIIAALAKEDNSHDADRVLRMYAIGIELAHLKELYRFDEVNELVYRRIRAKLILQHEALEHAKLSAAEAIHTDGRDVFEKTFYAILNAIFPRTEDTKIKDLYMYYRAQSITARKVLKELQSIDTEHATRTFSPEPLQKVIDLYTQYKKQSHAKATDIAEQHKESIPTLSAHLALTGAHKVAHLTLEDLYTKSLITNNLYITLTEELANMRKQS